MKKYLLAFTVLFTIIMVLSGCSAAATTTPAATTAPTTTASTTTAPPSTTTAVKPTATTSAPAATTAAAPQKGGTLNIISPNVPVSWGYPTKATAFFAPKPCIEAFIDATPTGTILPKLATSWVLAADKSSMTFTLRKGVKFHDGTDFNATAAKWNLDLFLARGTGSPADWKSVEALDDYTIRINYKAYKNTQLSNMTYGMISPTAVQKNSVDWAITHPVGTGPFMFKSFVPNTSLEYVRFDDYWGDKALVDAIKYIYIIDATTAAMAYQAGDAQVWESADGKTTNDLMKTGKYKIETRRGPLMNLVPDSANADSPFYSIDVRRAVELAIDKNSMVKNLGFSYWEAVDQPDVPEQFGHVELANPRNYDPIRAKELMKQAGYANGFNTRIFTSDALPSEPVVAIQGYLKAIGITATIEVQTASKLNDTRLTGWKNGLLWSTHGATDYNYCAYLERYYTPTSQNAYPVLSYPPDWLTTVNKMMVSSDPKEYTAYAQQLVRTHVDYALMVPVYVRPEIYLQTKNINNMGVGTHGDGFSWDFNKVWISK